MVTRIKNHLPLYNVCSHCTREMLDEVAEELKVHEGVVYEIYLDHLGFKTFGVGHLVRIGDPEYSLPIGASVSETRVNEALASDLQSAYDDMVKLFGPDMCERAPVEVRKVLINMMFNLGYSNLQEFVNFREAISNDDWERAAAEGRDSLWYNQVPNRAEELMSRLERVAN